MPPKAKFSKGEIIEAGLQLVQELGMGALTARELGTRLGSSSRPIFTVFSSMEEVQQGVRDAAKGKYRERIKKGLCQDNPFKGVGEQYILFAIQEPELFRLLFMTETTGVPDFAGILPIVDDSYQDILFSIQQTHGVDEPTAEILYQHMWIYTHGIATLCATRTCSFTEKEISRMISEVFSSLLKKIKGDQQK